MVIIIVIYSRKCFKSRCLCITDNKTSVCVRALCYTSLALQQKSGKIVQMRKKTKKSRKNVKMGEKMRKIIQEVKKKPSIYGYEVRSTRCLELSGH